MSNCGKIIYLRWFFRQYNQWCHSLHLTAHVSLLNTAHAHTHTDTTSPFFNFPTVKYSLLPLWFVGSAWRRREGVMSVCGFQSNWSWSNWSGKNKHDHIKHHWMCHIAVHKQWLCLSYVDRFMLSENRVYTVLLQATHLFRFCEICLYLEEDLDLSLLCMFYGKWPAEGALRIFFYSSGEILHFPACKNENNQFNFYLCTMK